LEVHAFHQNKIETTTREKNKTAGQLVKLGRVATSSAFEYGEKQLTSFQWPSPAMATTVMAVTVVLVVGS
jgi:hypothetical protein